jgi:t-SNARE complex subunit (syntaxin)
MSKKTKGLKKISKKDIRDEVTEKMAHALRNYQKGNSAKKFKKKLKKVVRIITPLAVKTIRKLHGK